MNRVHLFFFFFGTDKKEPCYYISFQCSNFKSMCLFFSCGRNSFFIPGLMSRISNNIVNTLLDHKIDRRSHHFVSALCFSLNHSHIEPRCVCVFVYVCVRNERWMIYIWNETTTTKKTRFKISFSHWIERSVLLFSAGCWKCVCVCVCETENNESNDHHNFNRRPASCLKCVNNNKIIGKILINNWNMK